MRKRLLLPLTLLFVCSAVMGQQTQPQPLTFFYDYTVRTGQEEEFNTLVKTVGAPVRDKLMADGVVLAYGLSIEEVKTDGDFTHFVWMATADMSGLDKIGAAFAADRARRSDEEQTSIAELFANVTEPDKARSVVTRSRIFRLPAAK